MPHESAPQLNQLENNKPLRKVEGVEHVELLTTPSNDEVGNESLQAEIKQSKTRRAFLLRNVRAALGLATASLAEKTDAQIATHEYGEKSNESSEYKEGILDMYKLALKKKSEVAKMYVKDGDKEYWVDASGDAGVAHMIIGGKELEKLAQDENFKPDRIDLVHTHPKNMVESVLKKHKEINARPDEFRSPPSMADLFLSYQMNKKSEDHNLKTKISNKAVDHTGVWTFDAPANSPVMELVSRENELLAERDQTVFENLQDSKDPTEKAVFEHLQKLKATDPRLASMFIDKDVEMYMKDNPDAKHNSSYLELKAVRDKINQNKDYKWIKEFELKNPIVGGAEKREEDVQEFIRRCKNLGITMEYEPIEFFQK